MAQNYINPQRLPIIGDDIAQIGQVIDILDTACSPSPELWVYAFWHEIPQVLWSIGKPEPVDFLIDRFGREHKRRRKRRFRASSILYSRVPVGRGLHWAVFSLQGLQRLGFYFLIADASTDFLVNWTSAAMQWEGCKVASQPYCEQIRNTEVGTIAGEWWPVSNALVAQDGLFGNGDTILVPPEVTASFNWEASDNPEHPLFTARLAATRLREIDTFTTLYEEEAYEGPDGVRHSGAVFRDWLTYTTNHQYIAEALFEGGNGFGALRGGSFNGYGRAAPSWDYDP